MIQKPLKIDEARKLLRQFRILMLSVVAIIVIGSTFYHFVEGWKWLDAVYFSVISLATVGYGDFTPKTDAGKLFTIGYLIVGIAVFAALINNVIKSRIAKRSIKYHEDTQPKK